MYLLYIRFALHTFLYFLSFVDLLRLCACLGDQCVCVLPFKFVVDNVAVSEQASRSYGQYCSAVWFRS